MKSKPSERKDVLFQTAVLIGGNPDSFGDAVDLLAQKTGLSRQYFTQVGSGHQNFGPNAIEKLRQLLLEVGPDVPDFVNLAVLGRKKDEKSATQAKTKQSSRRQKPQRPKAVEPSSSETVEAIAQTERKLPACVGGIEILPTDESQLRIHLPRGFSIGRLNTYDQGSRIFVQIELRFE